MVMQLFYLDSELLIMSQSCGLIYLNNIYNEYH